MKDISWDIYQIFLVVARNGGLSGAAIETGLSSPTLGRRILELEEAMAVPLFTRSQTGYRLTAQGETLFGQLQPMEAAMRRVEDWRRSEIGGHVTIRVAAGTWGARLIADNIRAIVTERDPIRLEFTIGERRAQLVHREHHIGIRAVRPDEPSLASRRLGDVAYAPYRQKNASDHLFERWIAVTETEAVSPYLQYPHRMHQSAIAMTVDRARSLLDLVRAGAGVAVLPCFVGDLEQALERAGPDIADLRHSQFLVSNSDDRARREIRTVLDRIFKLYKSHSDLFAGKRPSRI